jgi:hypothetical protein
VKFPGLQLGDWLIGLIPVVLHKPPELGQVSAHLAAGGAIEGTTEGFIQKTHVPDLDRSAWRCHPDGVYPPGYRPVRDRRFSAQIRSLRAINSQFSAPRDRSRPKREPSRGRVSMRVIVTARMVAATTLGSCAQGGDECPPLGLVATGCEDFLELEGYSRV